jgi:hypothetical protein
MAQQQAQQQQAAGRGRGMTLPAWMKGSFLFWRF